MKCQYVGWYSRQGCNEDALPGERFCNAHREQGPRNERSAKFMGGCLIAGIAFVAFIVVCAVAMR